MPVFKPVVITTTFPNQEEADKTGTLLLEKQLAACIQYETIQSQYLWEGKLCRDSEIRMLIKTARCHYAAIEKLIIQNHSYDCPQIIMQPVARGFKPYLKWLKQHTGL
ncbi:divalent-cation tolerance protein CutA [Neisseria weaveri]|uniref:Divalent-cation tolerance protein CutA n=1 Tax=Neisseria weaveri TaxID=28091 RepID=A0A3S4ZAQ7_9NEIS|nr:divalent-cation tolerance protein CutA [Neisseria weaveri]EGV34759.1 divalent-cation tolerance protein CutA [Neisseria weaveri ATCC 51223]EGV38077.1 divalent-cation tolerance protein CutA [Neisseria weaveri LMG 5135]SAY50698.1 Divalent-cation tolerance protein CutA [Neisseria weaveri]VEJ52097.1 Divalent-cation tolerance protein CutA [Neisseria weaveri]